MHLARTCCFIAYFLWISLNGLSPSEACDICAVHPYSEETGSVTTGTGSTLKKGSFVTGFTFEHRKWDELGHRNAHLLHEDGRDIHNFDHDEFYHFNLGYGVTDDFEMGLTMPVADKTFLRVEDGVVGQGDSSLGAGDLALTGKYRVWKDGVHVAVLGGVKFPTGDTAQKGFDGKKLEPEEVSGTGSFDYTLGVAASKPVGRWTVGADALYVFKTEGGQGREFGDVTRLDAITSYAVREPGTFPNIQLIGEFNAQFMQRDTNRSGKILDSGGQIFFLTPGVSVALNKQTSLFFSTPYPVYQNRGGQHPELKYSLITGINVLWD